MSETKTRPIRLVIVEDQPTILAQQKRLLDAFDQLDVVGTARNGMGALEVIEECRPDVVLLDLGLPDIDGIEVTRRIRSTWPTIEILIFTIFDEEERVIEGSLTSFFNKKLKDLGREFRVFHGLDSHAAAGGRLRRR